MYKRQLHLHHHHDDDSGAERAGVYCAVSHSWDQLLRQGQVIKDYNLKFDQMVMGPEHNQRFQCAGGCCSRSSLCSPQSTPTGANLAGVLTHIQVITWNVDKDYDVIS